MCAILRENTLEFQQAVNKLLDDNSNSYESLETLKNRIEHNFQIKDTYKEPKWSRTLHHPGIDVNEWIVTRNEDSPGKLVGAYLNQLLPQTTFDTYYELVLKIRKLTGYISIGVGNTDDAKKQSFGLNWPVKNCCYILLGSDGNGFQGNSKNFYEQGHTFKEGNIIKIVFWNSYQQSIQQPSIYFKFCLNYDEQMDYTEWEPYSVAQIYAKLRFCVYLLSPGDSVQIMQVGQKKYLRHHQRQDEQNNMFGDGKIFKKSNWGDIYQTSMKHSQSSDQLESFLEEGSFQSDNY